LIAFTIKPLIKEVCSAESNLPVNKTSFLKENQKVHFSRVPIISSGVFINMKTILLFVLFAYLLGSIPTAYIYCRLRGKDIRKEGSGNVGATNAARIFGKIAFGIIFFFDALKGFIPVWFAKVYTSQHLELSPALFLFSSFAAVLIGHIFPLFLGGKGGKGVATSMGGLLALMPLGSLCALALFGGVFYWKRRVSLGSLSAALALPLFSKMLGYPHSHFYFSIALALLIVYTHRSNIRRLLSGTEPTV
jgi:glycerol-3-phosphate acyltransferase PlsY